MAEVTQYRGHDCWRTWFFDECEKAGMFGLNEKHLGLIRLKGPGVYPYHAGTEVYLEDAPVFRESDQRLHRICGPYEVIAAEPLPADAIVIHSSAGKPIVYLAARPELGPWGDGTVRRRVAGLDLKYRQTAKQFNYYPYRFRIQRTARWEERIESHRLGCPLGDA